MDVPERIGDYAVERELGAGGMGTVYLARSRGGRTVAVKVARPELAADPHFRARFRAEVDAARRVGGFHTAQVVDADPDAAAPWLATAYIAGPTLSRLLAEQGPMGEARLRLLGAALAEALQAIHTCGLIHRDLKPGNIIMADDGPRVLDFGIARALESTRLTSTGAAFGTPGFLAPEQAQGMEVGGAADVFALGAVLVAAAGGHAFGEGTPMGLMYRAVHEPPNLSAVPEGIRPAVAACLAKEPAQRPTPEALLDLFAPDTAPEATPGMAGHPPTLPAPAAVLPAPAVPPVPTPAAGYAPAPAVGHIAGAVTVAAAPRSDLPPAFPQQPPWGQVQPPWGRPATTAPPRRKRTGLRVFGGVGALIVLGGGGYGIYGFSDAAFPKATHEIVTPATMVGGAYKRDAEGTNFTDPQPDDWTEKDVLHHSVDYLGTDKAPGFEKMSVYGSSGRFKYPGDTRDGLMDAMTVTGSENVSDGPKMISVPGSDVDFRCTTVDAATVCGWGDDSTTVAIEFTPAADSLEVAAAETSKIRDAIRKPIP
ncbi:serine/threonine-protein kinase [Streptomyces sp. NBC_01304]|uniref:serine/threonine-protein kinase n=1 Tax=Streptomyces sp. NBC_01304 TaxID=2903818 RepID=UPI003FA3A217